VPEILEIEMYRRGAEPVVGRTVASIEAPDDWYLKGVDASSLATALAGARIQGTGRRGKLMWLETTAGALGLRFGMTGRLVVDDVAVIDALEYSSKRLDPDWNRFVLHLEDGGSLVMNDPRRLGGVSLDPDLDGLGPDAWQLDEGQLSAILSKTRVALKAALLNQKRLAGLGNLLADELCWRAEIDPRRIANELGADDVLRLDAELVPMLDELYERGGSHLGDHVEARRAEAPCPAEGAAMMHGTVGGRSTWWCSAHQR
jgi:formamidopyrimidine-DNA glycosylase